MSPGIVSILDSERCIVSHNYPGHLSLRTYIHHCDTLIGALYPSFHVYRETYDTYRPTPFLAFARGCTRATFAFNPRIYSCAKLISLARILLTVLQKKNLSASLPNKRAIRREKFRREGLGLKSDGRASLIAAFISFPAQ